ncbi:MAG: hypothetical protein ABIT96_01985 [Ferruginibacter sp.]
MKAFTFMIFFTLLSVSSFSQDCKVEPDNLKGTYTGECISGKAEGKGIATGVNTYDGQFKKGYPDGLGKYTWEDKSWYSGYFKKGFKDGNGEMHYMKNGYDSLVTGFWKKDKYLGLYEKPYIVVSNTTRINRIDVRSQDKTGTTIIINMKALSQNFSPIVSDITVLKGYYQNKNSMPVTNGSMLLLKQVTFPFQARFYINNGEQVEILFNEAGDWDVNVDLQ